MFVRVAPNLFLIQLHRAKHGLKGALGHSLTVFTEPELKDAQCFLAVGEVAGYLIKPDGELCNVFSYRQGQGDEIVQHALRNGAKRLNCFAGYLEDVYSRNGFVEYDRVLWDDQYAPKGWNKALWGTPDVVFMRIDD